MEERIALTQYSKGAGCGCKISPEVLRQVIGEGDGLPSDPRLLVGYDTADDAAVVQLNESQAVISTVDFFMPIVDDAFEFGRIAAANALSDVYAMGGTPLTAVAILGWPVEKLPASLAARVTEGGRYMCRMAGIQLSGGHSVDSPEPFFGLAVTGLVNLQSIKRNSTAREGDVLFLTKPLGSGIITTAAKRGCCRAEDLELAISYMCTLNKVGEELGRMEHVNALTDITGFGLLGHLVEMCEGSGTRAEIMFSAVPKFPFLKSYLDQFIYPDSTTRNYSAYASKVNELSSEQLFVLCDPQTSGGLLISVAPEAAQSVSSLLAAHGLFHSPIGTMKQVQERMIHVK